MSKKKKRENPQDGERIAWHPAFFEAIQMQLEEYAQDLQFVFEYQLNKEPQRADVVIIKKAKDIVIENNIASIFRRDNIVEYKSPEDYISVKDFYHVYGYACEYQLQKGKDIREITLTFVGSHHPRELLWHLEKERGYAVEEKRPGIYIISGDIMPIQIIDSRELVWEGNNWLKSLDNELGKTELQWIIAGYRRQGKEARNKAFYDVIMRANERRIEEEMKEMRDALTILAEIFEKNGLNERWVAEGEARGIAEGEARGEEKKATEIAKNLLRNGFSPEMTAELSGLDMAKIITL